MYSADNPILQDASSACQGSVAIAERTALSQLKLGKGVTGRCWSVLGTTASLPGRCCSSFASHILSCRTYFTFCRTMTVWLCAQAVERLSYRHPIAGDTNATLAFLADAAFVRMYMEHGRFSAGDSLQPPNPEGMYPFPTCDEIRWSLISTIECDLQQAARDPRFKWASVHPQTYPGFQAAIAWHCRECLHQPDHAFGAPPNSLLCCASKLGV
jgi:hypothetical protein